MAKNTKRTVLVTGATGHQGGAVVRRLRERGSPVRVLTRDPDSARARQLVGHGTEVVRGDMDDPTSLTRAMDEVDGVFSVQSHDPQKGPEGEVRQGVNVVDAAKRQRIGDFVYSSVAGADLGTGIPHFESKHRIEEHVRNSGMRHTIFRPVFFMENWLGMREQIEQGTLAFPLSPETKLQMIAVDDIGAFVAMAFEKPGHWQGRTMEIAGDELSMADVVHAFSRMSGREVAYQQIPWDEVERKFGPDMTTMYHWFESVGYHVDISGVRQEHQSLMTFERWLQSKWVKTRTAA